MRWNTPIWDEMDLIFAVTYESDEPKPEGAEISEEDFDRILQESEEEDER